MLKDFASLHGHTHYSVLDGLSRPEEILQAAKEKGLKSVAITDHGVSGGHADFFLLGKKMGVRTVFGVEAYVIHSLEEWREQKRQLDAERKKGRKEKVEYADDGDVVDAKALRKKGHLVVLACNREGLANLNRLVFRSHKEGFYGKPRMDKDMLREHARGLVASSACMGGVVAKRLWDFMANEATWKDVVQEALEYDAIFGRGRFFLELQFNEMDAEQNYINDSLVRISQETGIPLTVTTDFHYASAEEWEAREVLHMLGWSKKTVQDMPGGRIDTRVKQLYVKSAEEMWQTYLRYGAHRVDQRTALQAFENTLLIDSLVEQYEPDTRQRLPALPYKNPFEEMGRRAIDELKRRGLDKDERYTKRLLRELKVIRDKGFANYFLVTQQIMQRAREKMLVGAGRGSSAASLVCYMLGITDLDPIRHDLFFERFLDPDRVELPDIDMDFQDAGAVKEMLKEMFGEDNVASLSTYGTFQIKGLLKDLSRVYGLDHNDVNKVNKKIESELRALYVGQDKSTIVIKLDDIERVSPTFNRFIAEHPEVGTHLRTLYGRNRHVGRHAAGVIIGDDLPGETSVFVATDKETGEKVVQASFTEGIVNKNVSAMGFVKYDLLNLACLRVIDHALHLLAGRSGRPYEELKEGIRPHNMDLDDQKVLRHIFWEGRFAGIFTFTEKGIRRLAQRVRPDTFDDVSAITSLYRPGPLGSGMDRLFVENKHHPEGIRYDHPLLEAILAYTRGCVVYQEQLMQVCHVLGKMTMKDVNRVRKVLLKKDKSKTEEFLKKENDELQGKFVAGCQENGLDEKAAVKWWEDLKKFGGYGFCKAHSYAYAVATMQCAHLATYHPLEFYAAVLTKAQAASLQESVADIQRCGIKVLPVDCNLSKAEHTIEGDALRLSFSSVLGVGPKAVAKMVAGQPYSSFFDFLDRSGASKTAVAPLILVGAFSSLPGCGNTKALESFYDALSADPKLKTKRHAERLVLLWEEKTGPSAEPDYGAHEKVFLENGLLGFSLSGSPFEILGRREKLEGLAGSGVYSDYNEFLEGPDDTGVVPAVVKEIKERAQRNGAMFAWLKFATESGEEFEAPCFATIWRNVGPRVKKGNVYLVTLSKDPEDPTSLKVGRPGWGHTAVQSQEYVLDLDSIDL